MAKKPQTVKLPKGFEDMVQVRPSVPREKQPDKVALLLLMLRNKDAQVYAYEMAVHVSDFATLEQEQDALRECYSGFIEQVLEHAKTCTHVEKFSGNKSLGMEPVSDQRWSKLDDPTTHDYADYVPSLDNESEGSDDSGTDDSEGSDSDTDDEEDTSANSGDPNYSDVSHEDNKVEA